jgi:GTPase involved in cell partitioning and DNA repair
MFIDEAIIKVISGKGGDGIVHFRLVLMAEMEDAGEM